ncbi:phage holin [Paraclostridium bifermentans]|uniref:phage holin n=1 Tax=Paraclostridium TaxID=1849822 RepID=UPI001CC3E0C6|nr:MULTISPECIES: phage holin [Paraclostridium]MBZ6007318.1 phage holin [Paraclostridium bifermentans]MDU0297842.1 phage holin [Paraclostridium sp. MRS3W1]
MKNKGEILNRLKNTGTIVAIGSAAVMIATNLGFDIDSEKVLYIINTICSVGVALGVLNNPTTSGLDNPMKK